MGALDDKLVWLDEFNKNIIDYDKVHYCVLWLLAVQCAHSFLANFHSNLLRLHPPPIFWSSSKAMHLTHCIDLHRIGDDHHHHCCHRHHHRRHRHHQRHYHRHYQHQICTELEGIVKKDRADLDNLIKPPSPLKSTDRWANLLTLMTLLTFSSARLVQAMDLADDIRAQEEISTAKQDLWNQGLAPEGKENTDEAKAFVKRMTDVATTLAALIKEADGEAAKYGQDIVLLAAFTNAQK